MKGQTQKLIKLIVSKGPAQKLIGHEGAKTEANCLQRGPHRGSLCMKGPENSNLYMKGLAQKVYEGENTGADAV